MHNRVVLNIIDLGTAAYLKKIRDVLLDPGATISERAKCYRDLMEIAALGNVFYKKKEKEVKAEAEEENSLLKGAIVFKGCVGPCPFCAETHDKQAPCKAFDEEEEE